MSFENGVLEGSGLDFGGPRRHTRRDFGEPGSHFWLLFLKTCGPPLCGNALLPSSARPPTFSNTTWQMWDSVLVLGFLLFDPLPFLKGLANVWEAAVSPLGGLQSAAHRRCAKRAGSQ